MLLDEETHDDWAVVTTQPCREGIAERELGRQGIVACVPRYLDMYRKIRLLFPGYLFAQGGDGPILRTRGITDVIGRLAHAELARWITPTGVVEMDDPLRPGIGVRLPRLHDLSGMTDGMDGDDRIWVLLGLLGRQVRASFRRADLVLA